MKENGLVYIIEKEFDPVPDVALAPDGSRPRRSLPQSHSTTNDHHGRPIVKFYFGPKRYPGGRNDKEKEPIAHRELVKKVTASFQKLKGRKCLIKSHMYLTGQGYKSVSDFLLGEYPDAAEERMRGDIAIPGSPYLHLSKRHPKLRIDAELDLGDFPEIVIESDPRRRESQKPRVTSIRFNTYVYKQLLAAYKPLERALFLNTQ